MEEEWDYELRQTGEVLALRAQGKIQKALDLLNSKLPFIEFYPEELPPALMILADLYDRLGKPLDAMAAYRRVVEEADDLEEAEVQREAFKKCISMLHRHGRELWVGSVKREARNFGFKINSYGEEYTGIDSDEEWTPEKTPRKRPRKISSSSEEEEEDVEEYLRAVMRKLY